MIYDLIKLSTIESVLNASVGKAEIKGVFSLIKGDNLIPFDGEVLFDDPEGADKTFAPHYEQHIRHHVKSFEEKRIEALHTLRKRLFIMLPISIVVIAAVIVMLLMITLSTEIQIYMINLALGTTLALAAWCYMSVQKYKSSVKSLIFPNIFSFFGKDYQYSEKSLLSASSLQPSDIIPHYTRERSEDYIKGSYKDVTLELMEAKLTKTSGSGKNRRTVDVFKGIFILLSMNKNFLGKTIVKQDAGKIANWLVDKFDKMENVKLEDPVFEKKFEVYSTDQVEARYLLTTSFMERLLELSALFGDSRIQCSFYNDKLLLMLPSRKNHFETSSIFQPATFTEDINTILKEMHLIFQIVDILKLNQRIGL